MNGATAIGQGINAAIKIAAIAAIAASAPGCSRPWHRACLLSRVAFRSLSGPHVPDFGSQKLMLGSLRSLRPVDFVTGGSVFVPSFVRLYATFSDCLCFAWLPVRCLRGFARVRGSD